MRPQTDPMRFAGQSGVSRFSTRSWVWRRMMGMARWTRFVMTASFCVGVPFGVSSNSTRTLSEKSCLSPEVPLSNPMVGHSCDP